MAHTSRRLGVSASTQRRATKRVSARHYRLRLVASQCGPCLQAARAGAHVLIEKPMASSLEACDAMLEAADRHHVKLGIVSQRRLFEPVQRMKAAIDAGKTGTPVLGTFSMFSWRDQAYYQSDPWRGKWATEGHRTIKPSIATYSVMT